MANVVDPLDLPSTYRDHKSRANHEEQLAALARTSTLYVGNLSFYTTEEQMHELFGRATDQAVGGGIKRIIMGLDRNTKTPCGFAFVEYYTHEEAVDCMRLISGTKLDERVIRCDLDPGYTDGRQYGRGRSGGQVRDEHRQEYDAGRGGWGHVKLKEDAERQHREAEEAARRAEHDAVYMDQERESGGRVIPSGAEGQYEEREGVERGDEVEAEREGRKRDRSEDDAVDDYEAKHQRRDEEDVEDA